MSFSKAKQVLLGKIRTLGSKRDQKYREAERIDEEILELKKALEKL